MTEEFSARAREALTSNAPIQALRGIAADALRDGVPKGELLAACEVLRREVSDAMEDDVLVVMDFLEGWCGPHERLCD